MKRENVKYLKNYAMLSPEQRADLLLMQPEDGKRRRLDMPAATVLTVETALPAATAVTVETLEPEAGVGPFGAVQHQHQQHQQQHQLAYDTYNDEGDLELP